MKFALALSLIIWLFSAAASSRPIGDLPNFAKVSEGLYRSGRPTEKGLLQAQQTYQIKTIIDLEDSMPDVESERPLVEAKGMAFYSFPVSPFEPPVDSVIDAVLKMLEDPSYRPILLHCHYGEDRTGLVIGLYRVLYEKVPSDNAYKEMLSFGFHTYLYELDRYYKEKTASKTQFANKASGF
jgi:protein tyrosine/serine phosphatase